MKQFSILFIAVTALLSFNACSDDDSLVIAQQHQGNLDFGNTFEDLYILEGMAGDSIVETFTWNEVDFNTSSPITYELEGATNPEFDSLETLASTSGTSVDITTDDFMMFAESDDLEFLDPENPQLVGLYFRVRAFLGDGEGNALEKYSDPAKLSIELPQTEGPKLNLYLVGDATEAGWNPDNNNTPMFRNALNDDVYNFSGYFNAGTVKFVETTAWAPQYGIDDSDNLVPRPTEADPDPAGITIEEAGYYAITVNLAELTYTIEAIDESEAAVYDSIGIVGDGTSVGWPSDDNPDLDLGMNQSEIDSHLWYLEDVELSDGPFKFRADFAWDKSWGGTTFPSGETSGDDIQATAGIYNIWFSTLDGSYILIPQSED